MTLAEIKAAVKDGKTVCWSSNNYEVVLGFYANQEEYWSVKCMSNNHIVGLTHADGVNWEYGDGKDFYIKEEQVAETIDMTPTWVGVLRIYLEVYHNGTTAESKQTALKELTNMAKAADQFNDLLKDYKKLADVSPEGCEFISKVYTEQTGGGIMVDYVELKDGKVICLGEGGLSVYPSLDACYDASEALGQIDFDSDALNPTDVEQWLEDNRIMILETLIPNQDVSDWPYSIECDENLEGNEKQASIEVWLPIGVYDHINWDVAEDIVERLCGKVLGEACLTSCDDDCTMLITLEEPNFRR